MAEKDISRFKRERISLDDPASINYTAEMLVRMLRKYLETFKSAMRTGKDRKRPGDQRKREVKIFRKTGHL